MNFDYTPQELETQERFAAFCRENLEATANALDQASISEARGMMRDRLSRLAGENYLGMTLPEAWGGGGKSTLSSLPFHEHLARACPATFVAAEASAGAVGGLIDEAGSDQQKAQVLKGILRGQCLAAFAVTEPECGSNLFDMETTAEKRGDAWVLNGTKTLITNGPDADVVAVLAVTDREAGSEGFSFFLVPRDARGLSFGKPVDKMGIRGSSLGDVTLQRCALPAEALLGKQGSGYALFQNAMLRGRIRFASLAIGIAKACLDLSLRHANERKLGGKPLFRNQEVSFKTADMQTMIDTAVLLTRYAAWLHDEGSPQTAVQASCAKLFASESANKIAHMAQQILGGRGYLRGNAVERLCRDVRYCEIGKGTSEVQRIEIAADVLKTFGKVPEPPAFAVKPPARRSGMRRSPERRVAICAVAQTRYERRNEDRFQGMALGVLESLLKQTGLDFSEDRGIHSSISVSDDIFDARTISDNAMTDVLGAHFRCEEKVAQEGAQAVYYGLATILSGHADLVLIIGHCKESQAQSRNRVTHMAFDPFFTRPVGMDFCCAAALQAQAYMARAYVTDKQLAGVVTRARKLAARNPHVSGLPLVTEEEVLRSPMLADPIRELHAYPVSDGAVGLVLASAERAREITDTPVWITGVGNCIDAFYLGERDLAGNYSLTRAAERAYGRAGIGDPRSAFDLIEISDQYAYQQPMWMEGLGFCEAGKGGKWLDEGGPDAMHVNESGGLLAGNPLNLGGLVRVAEVALQLAGKAGERQVSGAKRGLAHGVMGPAGQFHTVVILERDNEKE